MRRFVSTLLLVLLVAALADASAAPDDASSSVDESQLNDGVGSSRTNKTLVVVIGSLRGGELAWRSMYAHLLDLNSADLAITISNDALNATTASLVRRARYVWTHEEYEDWGDALDQMGGNGTWRSIASKNNATIQGNGFLGGTRESPRGSGAIIFYFRWFISKHIRRLQLHESYDRFVITRSDHYYGCAHDLSALDPRWVWIPEGKSWRGYTDRHVVASKRDLFKVLNILPPLVRHPERYEHFIGSPESFIKLRWTQQSLQVRRFPRMMFTCAAPGDGTRWKPMSPEVVAEGVHLKYRDEYDQTKHVCDSLPRGGVRGTRSGF